MQMKLVSQGGDGGGRKRGDFRETKEGCVRGRTHDLARAID